ncbi:hypothetical protein BKA80DRAFT_5848 [Phyllosticta citrichinensis]
MHPYGDICSLVNSHSDAWRIMSAACQVLGQRNSRQLTSRPSLVLFRLLHHQAPPYVPQSCGGLSLRGVHCSCVCLGTPQSNFNWHAVPRRTVNVLQRPAWVNTILLGNRGLCVCVGIRLAQKQTTETARFQSPRDVVGKPMKWVELQRVVDKPCHWTGPKAGRWPSGAESSIAIPYTISCRARLARTCCPASLECGSLSGRHAFCYSVRGRVPD